MKCMLKYCLLLIGLIGALAVHGAELRDIHARNLGLASGNQLVAKLGLGSGDTLTPEASAQTARGTQVLRMRQRYRGVPVYGRSIAIERDSTGHAVAADGSLLWNAHADLRSMTPRLSAAQALSALRNANGFLPTAAVAAREQRAELYVYPQQGGRARLAYLVSYAVDYPQPSRPTAIVDADTGAVVEQWEGLAHVRATGAGGNLKTGKYSYGTGLPYLDVTQAGGSCTLHNAYVKTYDMRHAVSGPGNLWTFICPDSDEPDINGAYAPLNDAHHFGGVVHDMYQNWFGAPPLKQALLLKVHYGNNYENAFWDGSSMSFGDGGNTFYPMVSLDLAGHEISHGFTEQHSGLQYRNQSGAINEAFSDMAGEAAEYFDRKGNNDFLVGAEIFKSSTGALRYMCNPARDGRSIDHAANYRDGMDVHFSSGVYNKAFCVLAKSAGWNTRKAFEVFQLANAVYWSATSTFDQGACGVEKATADKGYAMADVSAAFATVGVRCPDSVAMLRNGVPLAGLSGGGGKILNYAVAIPAGAGNLKIAISGGAGDADLYVKFGAEPTRTRYDCRPYHYTSNESCSFTTPSVGTYYVMLRGFRSFSGVTLTATWAR